MKTLKMLLIQSTITFVSVHFLLCDALGLEELLIFHVCDAFLLKKNCWSNFLLQERVKKNMALVLLCFFIFLDMLSLLSV